MSETAPLGCDQAYRRPSSGGVKNGHVHSLNRHRPEAAWRYSMCWHQAQELTGLASVQRTADWPAFVTERLHRVVTTEISADWGTPFLGRKDLVV